MVNALSRFGTFSGLQTIRSSEDNLPTFTFLKSHYSSKYLTFDSKEQEDQNHKALQPLTKVEQNQWQTYPEPGSSSVGFPFMDLNGKYIFTTPMVDPTLLQGKNWNQVAAAMATPGRRASARRRWAPRTSSPRRSAGRRTASRPTSVRPRS